MKTPLDLLLGLVPLFSGHVPPSRLFFLFLFLVASLIPGIGNNAAQMAANGRWAVAAL
jgi:hypothetical protein